MVASDSDSQNANMGRKALVDYSLIKEICENLTVTKNKFKGQLQLDPEDGPHKAGKKTEEIKRLLVSGAKKKSENQGMIATPS